MSVETEVKAVESAVVAEAVKAEGEVKAIAGDVKTEFEKVFSAAKVSAVAYEGSVAAEIEKLKAAVSTLDQSALVKALEAKVDALIAKIGVKL
jgi:hypothetical protein